MASMMQKLGSTALAFCILLTGSAMASNKSESRARAKLATSISSSIVKDLKTHLHLDSEQASGYWARHISQIELSFRSRRRATVQEARELIVRATERVLVALNSNELIRPYLAAYPFPSERIAISIRFDSGVEYYSGDSVSDVFSTSRGMLHYYRSSDKNIETTHLFEEPYAEALRIVTQSSLSDASVSQHTKRPYEDLLDAFCASFIKSAYKGLNIKTEYLSVDAREKIHELSFAFVREKPLSLEAARTLEITIMTNLLERLNANEALRPYLATYPFGHEQVKLELNFKNRRGFPFFEGRLSSVCKEKDTLLYYTWNSSEDDVTRPLGPLVVAEETYAEAFQKVSCKQRIKKL